VSERVTAREKWDTEKMDSASPAAASLLAYS
jgi:hypothetical protein